MFNKFTDRARKIIALAQKAAEQYHHDYIGPEHLLIGLVKEGSGVAVTALSNLGVGVETVRHAVENLLVTSDEAVPNGPLPITPQAKRALELAAEEARALNHPYIGTEHLLLGLISEQDTVAGAVLANLGLKLDDVRAEILDLLGESDVQKPRVNPAVARSAEPAGAQRLFLEAMNEVQVLGHQQIAPEHFQLALLNDRDSLTVQALVESGVDPDALRQRILDKLKGRKQRPDGSFGPVDAGGVGSNPQP
jgi:ATP-dependent Clp protease ATP-binding subunit ClpA